MSEINACLWTSRDFAFTIVITKKFQEVLYKRQNPLLKTEIIEITYFDEKKP